MVPFADPKQTGSVEANVVTSNAGSVIVTEVVATQPFTSVAVNVYVPAPKFVAVGNV